MTMKIRIYGLLIATVLLAASARAQVAFDNASTVQVATSITSKTFSFAVGSGPNSVLFVGVGGISSASPTSVTYAGSAMTLIKSATSNSGGHLTSLYALVAPATGANNVIVTFASAITFYSAAVSYSGMNQSTTADNSTTTSGTSTSTAPALTTVANNCWTIAFTLAPGGNITAGTGTTLRTGTGQLVAFTDSNAAITPAGSSTLNMSFTSSAFGTTMVSFAPSAGATVRGKFFRLM
jgi:hypothetical protein